MDLVFDRIEGARSERAIAFLHGILGRGSNLRTLAKRFVAAHPGWSALLVDLRGHGRSPKGTPGASLEAAARDVVELAARNSLPLTAIAGHSFGGKVALEVVRLGKIASLKDIFVIDSMPGAREPVRGGDSPLGIIDMIEAVPDSIVSITEFTVLLEKKGLARPVAQWLAASLDRQGDRVRFALDLDEIRALILDYFSRDLWPVVENPPHDTRVHLVIAERSGSYSAADRERAARIAASNSSVYSDVLPTGHWVHVEDLEGLLRVMNSINGSIVEDLRYNPANL